MTYRDEHEALLARNAALEDENARLRGGVATTPRRPVPKNVGLWIAVALVPAVIGGAVALWFMSRQPAPAPPAPQTNLDPYPTVEQTMAEAFTHLDDVRFGGSTPWEVVEATGVPDLAPGAPCTIQRTHRNRPNGRVYDPMIARCGSWTYDEAHEADAGVPVAVLPPPTDGFSPFLGIATLTFTRAEPPLRVVLRKLPVAP